MKRDMDLIRKMMLAAEESPHGFLDPIMIDGFTEEEIGYHAYLMVESGLANGINASHFGCESPVAQLTSLTSVGHDFIDSIRSEFIWDEVKAEIRKKGLLSAGVEMVKKIADKIVRRVIEAD